MRLRSCCCTRHSECRRPRTAAWLRPRTLTVHVHLRAGHVGDIERLGRLVRRTATGLVLAGGGARGAAHAGVFKTLGERGVPVDVVGGTSMGAVLGAVIALDASPARVIETFAEHLGKKPTGDYNVLPLLSLSKWARLRGMMERTEKAFGGSADLDIEDLWKTCYCVATNCSQAREQVLRSGPLVNAGMASCAIPGALPPVLHEGDLLCDGGTFNNFPADVMRGVWGVGRVIGVDLSFDKPGGIEHQHLPGSWALWRDLLRPRRRRRYTLPSLTNCLTNVTSLYSSSRQAASRLLTDVYMRPELSKVACCSGTGMRQPCSKAASTRCRCGIPKRRARREGSAASTDPVQAGLAGGRLRACGREASAAAASFLPSALKAAIAGRCPVRGRALPASHW